MKVGIFGRLGKAAFYILIFCFFTFILTACSEKGSDPDKNLPEPSAHFTCCIRMLVGIYQNLR